MDSNYLNTYSKEFPKEVNELKYLIAVFNDLRNHYNTTKNSIETENKLLESFFKNMSQTLKITCRMYFR